MLTVRLKKRLVLLRVIFFFCFLILAARLFVIQCMHYDFYKNYGNLQYKLIIKETPARALIYDRHGKILALNQPQLALFITPNNLKEPEKIKAFLKKYFPDAYERYVQHQHASFMYVKRRLHEKELTCIQKANLTDLYIMEETQRYYTNNTLLPVVGMTDIDNFGLFGLELFYDKQLSGEPAIYYVEKEARSRGYYFKKAIQAEGIPGTALHTTLDSTLQFLVYQEVQEAVEEWGSSQGAALIMDPTTGDILACVNYPTQNPSDTASLDLELVKNKVITDVHEFGSVMKIFPALAALEEKVVTADEIIDCENKKIACISGITFSTWKAHGLLPYVDVVALSNNIGTSKVAARLGPKLYDHLKRLKFGKKTGIHFPGEVSGFVNPPDKWTTQSPFSLSFGYEISATLLQLGQAFSMIAHDGYLVKPRFALNESIVISKTPLYSKETLEVIRTMLLKTITDGTAHQAKIPGYLVIGKTGTANMLENGTYNTDRNIFTFAAIIKKGNYQRVIIVFLQEANKKNVYASSVAVPLFERIAQKMLIHDGV